MYTFSILWWLYLSECLSFPWVVVLDLCKDRSPKSWGTSAGDTAAPSSPTFSGGAGHDRHEQSSITSTFFVSSTSFSQVSLTCNTILVSYFKRFKSIIELNLYFSLVIDTYMFPWYRSGLARVTVRQNFSWSCRFSSRYWIREASSHTYIIIHFCLSAPWVSNNLLYRCCFAPWMFLWIQNYVVHLKGTKILVMSGRKLLINALVSYSCLLF